jgi:hypothetical protein
MTKAFVGGATFYTYGEQSDKVCLCFHSEKKYKSVKLFTAFNGV